jgi:hypothetical protein
MSKTTIIILVIVGCLLLAVANLALWAALDVFNPARFGERVAQGLQSDAATAALGSAIVDRITEYYPEFPVIAQAPAAEVVAWLLQRPVFTPVFKETAAVASVVMTTSADDVIGVDLSEVGPYVVGIVSVLDPEAGANIQAAVESAQESGLIAIYESGTFPKLRQIANTVPWLWPLAGLGAIALFVVAYLRAQNQPDALKYIGVGVVVTGGLELLLIPALHAPVQNNIIDPVMRTVVGEVLSVLTRGLAIQCLLLIFIGVVAIVVSHNLAKKDVQVQASPEEASTQPSPDVAADPTASAVQ